MEQTKMILQDAITEVLDKHGKEYDYTEISSLIDRWSNSKKSLIEKMRKHPNWNEEALAVILTTDEIRDIDSEEVSNTINNMLAYAKNNNIIIPINIWSGILILRNYHQQFMDTDTKVRMQYQQLKANEGQKVSRLLNSLFKKAGLDKLPEYNKLYAKVADAFNPLVIKRTSVLSVHPCDYLHMSYGTGWKSCHNIDDGCYMAGTLSYMGDEVSLIFYTINNDYSGNEYYNQRKITRNVFCYSDTMLMQSRLYPNNDEDKKTQYREIVQRIFSVCDNIPNLWIKKNSESLNDYCMNHYAAKHYADYIYSEYKANISLQKDFQLKDQMIIGSTCYCLTCGEEIDEENDLYCDDCGNSTVCCNECGEAIYEEDAYIIDGEYYCRDCVSYCERCGEHVLNVTDVGGYYYVCDDCLENHYTQCDDCGTWIEEDESYSISNGVKYVCGDCIENYVYCEGCGEYYYAENCAYIEGENRYICEDCYSDDYFMCEECENVHRNRERHEYEGKELCNDCYSEVENQNTEVA